MGVPNKNLKTNFEAAVDDYVNALLYMWSDHDKEDPAFAPAYGYWAGGDRSGAYCYGDDLFISLSDLIYRVENNVPYGDYAGWADYCSESREFGFEEPALRSWVGGCPRVPEETFERLREELDSMVEIVKQDPNRIF